MSIKYDFYENPQPPHRQGEKKFHARVVGGQTVSTEKLIKHMKAHGVQEATIVYALTQLVEYMEEQLWQGNNVHLNGLGYFGITLDCPETHDPAEHHAQSIGVKSVVFRPEKALLGRIRSKAAFERARFQTQSVACSVQQIEEQLQTYFQTHDFLTNKDLCSLFSLKRNTAAKRLKALVEKGVLENKGTRHQPIYVPVRG